MLEAGALLEQGQRLGLALAIGFLVGVERGWKQRTEREGERAAGLRTFALVGLLGGVTALLAPIAGGGLAAALALAFCIAFIIFQMRQAADESDNSATSTVAASPSSGSAPMQCLAMRRLLLRRRWPSQPSWLSSKDFMPGFDR